MLLRIKSYDKFLNPLSHRQVPTHAPSAATPGLESSSQRDRNVVQAQELLLVEKGYSIA
jgi:hypothetical protein